MAAGGIALAVASSKRVESLTDAAPWPRDFRAEFSRRLAEVEDLVFAELERVDERLTSVSPIVYAPEATPRQDRPEPPLRVSSQVPEVVNFTSRMSFESDIRFELDLENTRSRSSLGEEVDVSFSERERRKVSPRPTFNEACETDTESSVEPGKVAPEESAIKRVTRFDEVLATIRHTGLYAEDEYIPFWERVRNDPRTQLRVVDGVGSIVVLLNSFMIGASEDLMENWRGWFVMDVAFATMFVIEPLVKMRMEGIREFWRGSDKNWNRFEVAIALLSVVEVLVQIFTDSQLWLLRVSRLFRITRLLRVARLSFFAELMVMIKGSVGGMKTLCWASVLICLPLYTIAIGFRLTLGPDWRQGYGAEYFMDIQTSFFTLFRCIVSKECTDTLGRPIMALIAEHHGWGFSFVFCIADLFMSFGLFNVIGAIFIENVLAKAKTNAQMLKRARLADNRFFAEKMVLLVQEILQVLPGDEGEKPEHRASRRRSVNQEDLLGSAADVELTPELWEEVRVRPVFIEVLRDLDVADEDTMNLFETLDADGSGTIDLTELFDGIAKLRGSATRSDIIAINFMIQKVQENLQETTAATAAALERQEGTMQMLKSMMRREFSTAAKGRRRPGRNSTEDFTSRSTLPVVEAFASEPSDGTPRQAPSQRSPSEPSDGTPRQAIQDGKTAASVGADSKAAAATAPAPAAPSELAAMPSMLDG